MIAENDNESLELGDADLALERPRATLAEIAADKLREFILLEKLRPGAPVPERDISAALGISRTPLRGALTMLEQEGLVRYSATRRPHVADPSLQEISQYLVVMGTLEALAGELACDAASDEQIYEIVAMEQSLADRSGKVEALEFFRGDMQMHTAIVKAAGNPALMATHQQYNARLWRARFVSSRRSSGREQTIAEHKAIVEGLSSRNASATAASLRTHLSSAVANYSIAISEQQQPEN